MIKEHSLGMLKDESPDEVIGEDVPMRDMNEGMVQIAPGHWVHPDHTPTKLREKKLSMYSKKRKVKRKQSKKSRRRNRKK